MKPSIAFGISFMIYSVRRTWHLIICELLTGFLRRKDMRLERAAMIIDKMEGAGRDGQYRQARVLVSGLY